MSRRSRGEGLAPSMFPFLAVLLCTMGSLVLILMLIVAGAQASTSEAKQQHSEKKELLESQLDVLSRSATKRLYEGRIALEKERLRLQHFEEHIAEIAEELLELQTTLDALDSEDAIENQQQQFIRLSELEKQIAEAAEKLKVKELEKPDEGDKPIFAIIPYDGPNGTHRRPIYLECDSQGVIIQPEGVRLSMDDIKPPYGPGNPLDAALRTIRSEYKPANGAVTSTAYPLLVVRPNGIESYARARAAMSGWDDQFGYELVQKDLELAFPEPKPGLDTKLARAIDSARERQAALLVAMPRKYGAPPSGRLRSQTGGGGAVAYPGGRYARGGADGSNSDGNRPQGGNGAAGSSSRGGYGFGPGTESGQLNALEQSLASGASGGSVAFDPSNADHPINQALEHGAGVGGPLDGNGYGGQQDGRDSFGGSGSEIANGNAQGQFSQAATGGAGSSQAANGQGSNAGGSSGGNPSADGSSATNSLGVQSMPGGSQIAIPSFGLSSQAGQQASSNNAGSSRQQPSGASQSKSSGSSSGSQGGRSGNSSQPSSATAQPVARSQGENWVTHGSQQRRQQTPVRRTIRMVCTDDAWIVVPSSRLEKEITIPMEGSPAQRAEKLAEVIRKRIDAWGLALEGGYWRPELVVEVRSGAMWRFQQLERLFLASGIDIRRDASKQPAPGR